MTIEMQLLLWWVLFGGTHVAGSSVPVRTRLIRALGLRGFKALYSIVALATFIPLVLLYWTHRHEGPLLYDPAGWMTHATEIGMLLSVLFLVLGLATPSPVTSAAELGGPAPSEPRGIQRITRHPMNTAFALFGADHMLSNPTTGDWIFWGGFVFYSVVSAMHQDRRVLATGPEAFKAFHAATSLVPFAAIAGGRQRLVLRELQWWGVLVALALFVALRWVHPAWIGGFR